jgi:hypothetical protein
MKEPGSIGSIQMESTALVLSLLLDHIYPVDGPEEAPPLGLIQRAIMVSANYKMDLVTKKLRKQLVAEQHLLAEPLHVWAIASAHGLSEEANIAFHKVRVDLGDQRREHFLSTPAVADLPAIHFLTLLRDQMQRDAAKIWPVDLGI